MLKKKILIVLTIMTILVSMIPVNVINAETLQTYMTLYVYPDEANGNVFVGVFLNSKADFAAANFELTYNKDALSYASGAAEAEMKSGTNKIKDYPEEGKIKIAYMADPDEADQTKQGAMYGFNFNIKEGFTGEIKFDFTNPVMKRRDGTSFAERKFTSYVTIIALLKSISLDKTSLSLTEGQTDKLNVIYNPENATVYDPTIWTSSDETIATVDDSGNVTAISEGVATITASIGESNKATCTVSVNKAEVLLDSISLNKTAEDLVVGQTDALSVKYNPENITESVALSWSSSNEEVATVVDGVVTALKAGNVTITVSANGKVASCTYIVKDIELESIALSDVSAIMEKGTTKDLAVIYNPENTTVDKTVTWTTTDENIATVDGNGKVTAVGNGTATITATSGGKTATCDITVKTTLDSIVLNQTSATIIKGDSKNLEVILNPADATIIGTTEWTSSNEMVATVSNGIVTGINPGKATITATLDGKATTCEVIVLAPITSISLNKTETTIIKGENETLTLGVEPANTTDDIVATWTSSDETVATVYNGVVNAKNVGKTTITAIVGGKIATCEVTVVDIELDSIKLNKNTTEINKGQNETLIVSYNPENTTIDKTVEWSSSNEEVATVNNGVITAKAKGTAKITAKVGDKVDTCIVKVLVPLESIALDKTQTTISKGSTDTLKVTFNPENTTDDTTVEWKSADEKIAIVENGIVTPIGKGTTTITAKVGDKEATCEVTVIIPLESISLSKAATTIIKNQTEKLEVKYNPEDATVEDKVEWTSLDTNIATVVDGIVTGRKTGTVTILAKVDGKVANCDVTVKEIELEALKLGLTETEIKVGQSLKMNLEYIPENTTIDKDVEWTSSNESIAKVDNEGIVTAIKPGDAVITATVAGKSVSCVVTVPEVHLKDAYIVYELVEVSVGEMIQMYISTEPEITEVTDDINTIWMSEDESVATVDENGMVTAQGVGQTRISLVVNGMFESYVTVVVNEAPVQDEETTIEEGTINTTTTELAPATGDIAVVAIVIIAITSVAGIVFLAIRKKNKKQ